MELTAGRLLLYAADGDEFLERVHEAGLEPLTELVRRSTLEDVFLTLESRTQDRQTVAGLTSILNVFPRYATCVPGEFRQRAVAAGGGIDVDAVGMRRGGPAARAAGGAWRDPVTWALAAVVFCAYFSLSLFRLLQLSPVSYDLGIYTEYVKQLSQLHAPVVDVLAPGFNLLGNHFQVAVAVLAPFFRLVPSPATLLFFQALATAISVFPVVSAGYALSGKATGRLIGFAYGFSWGLQQMIVFDFHEIALSVPLLAFSLSALVRRRPLAAIGWAMPLVFVEESQGFTVAAIGLLLAAVAVYPGLLPGPAVAAGLPPGGKRGGRGAAGGAAGGWPAAPRRPPGWASRRGACCGRCSRSP